MIHIKEHLIKLIEWGKSEGGKDFLIPSNSKRQATDIIYISKVKIFDDFLGIKASDSSSIKKIKRELIKIGLLIEKRNPLNHRQKLYSFNYKILEKFDISQVSLRCKRDSKREKFKSLSRNVLQMIELYKGRKIPFTSTDLSKDKNYKISHCKNIIAEAKRGDFILPVGKNGNSILYILNKERINNMNSINNEIKQEPTNGGIKPEVTVKNITEINSILKPEELTLLQSKFEKHNEDNIFDHAKEAGQQVEKQLILDYIKSVKKNAQDLINDTLKENEELKKRKEEWNEKIWISDHGYSLLQRLIDIDERFIGSSNLYEIDYLGIDKLIDFICKNYENAVKNMNDFYNDMFNNDMKYIKDFNMIDSWPEACNSLSLLEKINEKIQKLQEELSSKTASEELVKKNIGANTALLQDEISTLKTLLETTHEDKEKLQSEIKVAKEEILNYREVEQSLGKKVGEFKANLIKKEEEIDFFIQQIYELNIVDNYPGNLDNLNNVYEYFETHKTGLKIFHKINQEKRDRSYEEIKKLQEEIIVIETKLGKKISDLQDKLAQAEDDKIAVESLLRQQQEISKFTRDKEISYQKQIDEITKKLNDFITAKDNDMKKAVSKEQVKYNDILKGKEDALKVINEKSEELQRKLSLSVVNNEGLEKRIKILQKKIQALVSIDDENNGEEEVKN